MWKKFRINEGSSPILEELVPESHAAQFLWAYSTSLETTYISRGVVCSLSQPSPTSWGCNIPSLLLELSVPLCVWIKCAVLLLSGWISFVPPQYLPVNISLSRCQPDKLSASMTLVTNRTVVRTKGMLQAAMCSEHWRFSNPSSLSLPAMPDHKIKALRLKWKFLTHREQA